MRLRVWGCTLVFITLVMAGLGSRTTLAQSVAHLEPERGTSGTSLRIYGSGFGSLSASDVLVGGMQVSSLLTPTQTLLEAEVPTGLSGPVDVSVGGQTVAEQFTVVTGGAATFPTQATVVTGETGVRDVAVGDVTGDGIPDVVTAATGTDEVRLFAGNGDGTFGAGSTIGSGVNYARTVALADIDGDGRLDIVVAAGESAGSDASDQILYFLNNGGGSFSAAQSVVQSSPVDDVRDLAVGSLDDDGFPDLVAVSQDNDTVARFLNETDQGNGFASLEVDGSAGDPRAVVLADLDGDDRQDIVVGSVSDDNITWYPNTGGGSFGSGQNIATSNAVNPRDLTVADLNGDGALDVIAALRGNSSQEDDGNVTWYANSGDGSNWSPNPVVSGGTDQISAVQPADVNGDGQTDLVAGSRDGSDLLWFENNAGSFGGANVIDSGTDNIRGIGIGDFERDGTLDPVVANLGNGTVTAYPNLSSPSISVERDSLITNSESNPVPIGSTPPGTNLTATFTVKNTGGVPLEINGLSVDNADFYNVSSSALPGMVPVGGSETLTVELRATNEGEYATDVLIDSNDPETSSFSFPVTGRVEPLQVERSVPDRNALRVDTSLSEITVTFNAPLDPATVGPNRVQVFGGQSGPISEVDGSIAVNGETLTFEPKGRFQPGEHIRVRISSQVASGSGVRLEAGHVLSFRATAEAADPLFVRDSIGLSGQGASSVRTADLDEDGRLEVLTASNPNSSVSWYDQVEDGQSRDRTVIDNEALGVWAAIPVDVNRDGAPDIVAALGGSNEIQWYENDGASTPTFTEYTVGMSSTPRDIAAGDLDGDGDPDVVAVLDGGSVIWFENQDGGAEEGGNLQFGESRTISTDMPDADAVAVGDIDGDGSLDVVTAASGNNTVAWHENPDASGGQWTTTPITTEATATSESDVAVGDLNGDGDLDVMTASDGDDTVAWFENREGTGTDWSRNPLTTDASGAQFVVPSNLDGDGDLDVLFTAPGEGRVAWVENTGDGAFGQPTDIASGYVTLREVSPADVNGDGRLDAVVAGGAALAWHPNGAGPPLVTTTQAENIRSDRFLARGTVEPRGASTTVQVQYGRDRSFGEDTTAAVDQSPVGGIGATAVQAEVQGLTPSTTYYYRVKAINEKGVDAGMARSVTTANEPPITSDDRASTKEDSTVTIAVLSNDTDLGGRLDPSTLTVTEAPSFGSTSVDGAAGTITYTPAPDSNGTDRFRYRVSDAEGASSEATVTVRVAAVNDSPIARPDTASVPQGGQTTIAVLEGDRDIDSVLDSSSVTIQEGPSHGTVSVAGQNGAVTYRHDGSDQLMDQFQYTVADREGAVSDPATVKIDVLEVGLASEGERLTAGSQRVGLRGDTAEVQVENTGQVSLSALSVTLAEGTDFSVVEPPDVTEMAPGEEATARVAFGPTASGSRTDTLLVTASKGTSARVPLIGQGVEVDIEARSPSLQERGAVPISVTLDGGFAPAESHLFARKGGTQTYEQFALQKESDTTYEASLPRELVTERGIDYYVRLSDGRSVISVPGATPEAAAQHPRHLPVQFDGLEAEGAFEAKTYRMVSIPARPEGGESLRETLEENYGSYDTKAWRLLRWGPAEEDYRSYPELDTLAPGYGVWLVTQSGEGFALSEGQTVDASEPYRIRVEPGWNQIGSPFGFAVPWDSVRAATNAALSGTVDLGNPVAYRDSTYAYNQGVLRPWQGYFVHNATSTPDTLVVPPTGGAETSKRGVMATAGGAVPAQAAADSGRYTMQVHARVPETGMADRQTYLGFRQGAQPGHDDLDFAAAPPIGAHVRAELVGTGAEGEERHYAGSFKPAEGDGQVWVLAVSGEFGDAFEVERTVDLRFETSGQLPSSFGRYVLDLEERRMIPLEKGRFSIPLASGEERRFKVILGTKSFAQSKSEGIALQAFEDRLLGNAPNPFRNETTIQYQLSEQRTVTIDVFNVLGQRVRRLVRKQPKEAGLHTVRWQGRNQYGKPVGSGVYFYRIEAGDFRASRKMVLVR